LGIIELAETKVSESQVKGKYGKYGGQYVPEVLMPALEELEAGYERYKNDPEFLQSLTFTSEILQAGKHLFILPGI